MSKLTFKRSIHKQGGSLVGIIPDYIIKMRSVGNGSHIVWIVNGNKIEVEFE